MWFLNFKLINKVNLTNDVFELTFEIDNDFLIIPWKFITFLLPKTWFWRAYSVLDKIWNKIYFIIKRLENGRWWSREICDIEIWTILKWVWPTGNFIDSKNIVNKLFIATWTWVVPLYFMIKNLLENWYKKNLKLILWNRFLEDLYYVDKFSEFKNKYSNFNVEIYLSREEKIWFKKWYVGNFLVKENIKDFSEFYICGNSNMVDEVVNKLKDLWLENENIFHEKY